VFLVHQEWLVLPDLLAVPEYLAEQVTLAQLALLVRQEVVEVEVVPLDLQEKPAHLEVPDP